jgi:hypothetical protein
MSQLLDILGSKYPIIQGPIWPAQYAPVPLPSITGSHQNILIRPRWKTPSPRIHISSTLEPIQQI